MLRPRLLRFNMTSIADRSHIDFVYQDPLDLIWVAAAQQMGMHVERSDQVFAAWDGQGTLTVGTPETLDPDDCLAQIILHEVCHALVEGPDAPGQPDWGINILNPAHRDREHSCLRLQAALTTPHGLRTMLGATTAFRAYYDQLPEDPLAADDDPAVDQAVAGWHHLQKSDWRPILDSALQATAQIAQTVAAFADRSSLWSTAVVHP